MAVFRSLLVALDGSQQSNAACALALALAKEQGAMVTFVNVIESDEIIATVIPSQGFVDPTLAIDQLRNTGGEILRSALAAAQSAGVKASSQLAEGGSVDKIIEQAQSCAADLIVMGSHARAGLERLLLGSVAEGVLRKSAVPVLIAKA